MKLLSVHFLKYSKYSLPHSFLVVSIKWLTLSFGFTPTWPHFLSLLLWLKTLKNRDILDIEILAIERKNSYSEVSLYENLAMKYIK